MKEKIIFFFFFIINVFIDINTVSGQEFPYFELPSGTHVAFERYGIFKFTNSDDVAIILTFRTRSNLIGEDKISEEAKSQLIRDATDICKNHSQEFINSVLETVPFVKFSLVGIRIRKQLGTFSSLKKFRNWTSSFRLTDNKCGEPAHR